MKACLIIGIYLVLVCCREKIQLSVVEADLTEEVYADTTWFSGCEIIFPETTDREMIVTADRPYKFLYYDYDGNFLREKTSEASYYGIARTADHIKPVITVDFGKYNYNPAQLNEEPYAPGTRNKVLSITNVKEIRGNLFFNTNKIGLSVYNKTQNQIIHAYGITNTNLGVVLHSSIATEDTNNGIIAFSYDTSILQRQLAGIVSDNSVIKHIQHAKEDDNPILFLYKSI